MHIWQTAPYIAPAPQAALPAHVCLRERKVAAQAQAIDIDEKLERAENGLRQHMSREQEVRQAIADLEAQCAYISYDVALLKTLVLTGNSGEGKEGTFATANCRVT